MIKNFCKLVVDAGGKILPLTVPPANTGGTGIMNPSVFVDEDGILLNMRVTNYTLYHSEGNQQFFSAYGPLVYMNPENDHHLKTENYLCRLGKDLRPEWISKVVTSLFKDQLCEEAEFHGLEDARVVRWNKRLFICGVRRDTEPTGKGRIEMSELAINGSNEVLEFGRFRLEPPKKDSFVEKNWMPILDMPYHFVKWTNPLEIVRAFPDKGETKTVVLHHNFTYGMGDIRGGSQVIPLGDFRICIVHEVSLKRSMLQQKDAKYTHRFVLWDKNWNLVSFSEPFSFLCGEIEFCCGLASYNNSLLITFGFQDNASYILEMPVSALKKVGIDLDVQAAPIEYKFAPVYYITHERLKQRQSIMKKQFKKLGITAFKAVVATDEMDKNIKAKGKYVHTLDQPTLFCVASHLRAIKQWYVGSAAPYAIFLEDDAYLDTMQYWSFSWHEFVSGLPKDWDCIQLSCVRENLNEIRLRERKWDDWSVMAYMITREYARRLVNEYIRGDELILEIPGQDIQPLAENIIYVMGRTYTVCLFTENIQLTSTSHGKVLETKHKPNHVESFNFIEEWWRRVGLNTKLSDIL